VDVAEAMSSINLATTTTEIMTMIGIIATATTVGVLITMIIAVQHTMRVNPAIVACLLNG
jgi:hypothetical protein